MSGPSAPLVDTLAREEETSWQEVSADVYRRPLVASEMSASFNQNIADGHTELCTCITFTTRLTNAQIEHRARQAWRKIRLDNPSVGVELSTHLALPQFMTYRILRDAEDIASWEQQTFHVLRGVPLADVARTLYRRRIPTMGKQTMLYLGLGDDSHGGTRETTHFYAWNTSHVTVDIFSSAYFTDRFLQLLVEADDDVHFDLAANAPLKHELLRRLPRSIVKEYEEKYSPTPAEREAAVSAAKANMALYAGKVGVAPAPMHTG